MNNDLITNAAPHARRILFNVVRKNGKISNVIISPILSARRSNSDKLPTTYQGSRDGDVIVSVSENLPNVLRVEDSTLTNKEKQEIIDLIPEDLKVWLRDVKTKRYTGFIPEPYGWINGMTKTESIKYVRIQRLLTSNIKSSNLTDEWINGICRDGVISPRVNLNLDWREAKPMPKNRHIEIDCDSYAKVDIIYISDGVLALQHFKKVIFVGDFSNKNVKRQIPNDVDRMIIIKHGVAINSEGEPFGISIELFRS